MRPVIVFDDPYWKIFAKESIVRRIMVNDRRHTRKQIFQATDEAAIFKRVGAQFLERRKVQVRVHIATPLAGVVVALAVFGAWIVVQFEMIMGVDQAGIDSIAVKIHG